MPHCTAPKWCCTAATYAQTETDSDAAPSSKHLLLPLRCYNMQLLHVIPGITNNHKPKKLHTDKLFATTSLLSRHATLRHAQTHATTAARQNFLLCCHSRSSSHTATQSTGPTCCCHHSLLARSQVWLTAQHSRTAPPSICKLLMWPAFASATDAACAAAPAARCCLAAASLGLVPPHRKGRHANAGCDHAHDARANLPLAARPLH